ncbi:MAG: hypothetical protein HUK17_01015 [Bacteroidales bacterium]|nr:hypothetical protein [Bacteroidales bacterium]
MKHNTNAHTTMNNILNNSKKTYLSPELEVFEFEVERGFAVTDSYKVYNIEEINELTDRGGEAYHGEWF